MSVMGRVLFLVAAAQFFTSIICDANVPSVCGDWSLQYIFLLSPSLGQLPYLTKYLNSIKSAAILKNTEYDGFLQVLCEPRDWEDIYRHTIEWDVYLAHSAFCIDKSEFSALQLRLHRNKGKKVLTNAALRNLINRQTISSFINNDNKNYIDKNNLETMSNSEVLRDLKKVRKINSTTSDVLLSLSEIFRNVDIKNLLIRKRRSAVERVTDLSVVKKRSSKTTPGRSASLKKSICDDHNSDGNKKKITTSGGSQSRGSSSAKKNSASRTKREEPTSTPATSDLNRVPVKRAVKRGRGRTASATDAPDPSSTPSSRQNVDDDDAELSITTTQSAAKSKRRYGSRRGSSSRDEVGETTTEGSSARYRNRYRDEVGETPTTEGSSSRYRNRYRDDSGDDDEATATATASPDGKKRVKYGKKSCTLTAYQKRNGVRLPPGCERDPDNDDDADDDADLKDSGSPDINDAGSPPNVDCVVLDKGMLDDVSAYVYNLYRWLNNLQKKRMRRP
ncbi:uncharacterized protein LOC105689482 [Athalia rosae]|uniref:uncharacterized protein LOC105689482 n=1 Tax=Athalia rosae TaxID=37344 RepID=UPI0020336F2F|nr:uncharacterized protein LOC105689482 [Athalia rosae]